MASNCSAPFHYTHHNTGTCSRAINVTIVGDIVSDVEILGGCAGNTKGICQLVKGMKVDDVIAKCHGIPCRDKGTSCPDQLAKALIEAKEELGKQNS